MSHFLPKTMLASAQNIFEKGIISLGALSIIGYSAVQFCAALPLIPNRSAIESLKSLDPISAAELSTVIAAENTSIAISPSPEGYSILALTLALRSEGKTLADLEEASRALRQSLLLAPANPYGWARLATIEQTFADGEERPLTYLRMSLMTGPNEDRLFYSRVRLALQLWPELTANERQTIFSEIRWVWAHNNASLVEMARTNQFTANAIRAALATNIQDLLYFEKLFSIPAG